MPDELRLLGALLLGLIGAGVTVPLAIRLAGRTAFLDKPAGYKGHGRPTPYLGGAAVIMAFLVPAIVLGGGASENAAILLGALTLLIVGTVDDRVPIGPLPRVVVEAGVAVALWKSGFGWSVFDSETANLLLTVFWVVGIVNAFNLMDNMDGAAGSVAAVSATGVAVLALTQDRPVLAALLFALVGACAGFLPRNLASPSGIFLGDGGSMPLGFVVAACVMLTGSHEAMGLGAVLAAVPFVGLPVLDTTLVVISRRRRGAQILSGGRDHLTHRLRAWLGTPRRVAVTLAVTQAALCAVSLAMFGLSRDAVIACSLCYLLAGAAAIWALEIPREGAATEPAHSPPIARAQSKEPVL